MRASLRPKIGRLGRACTDELNFARRVLAVIAGDGKGHTGRGTEGFAEHGCGAGFERHIAFHRAPAAIADADAVVTFG